MKVNGVELQDLDLLDLDIAEKYENVLEDIKDIGEKIQGVSMVESIRTQCNAIFNVFNTMFGEGTDKKVFGDKVNLLTCLKAFEELVMQMGIKSSEIERLTNKYSPNRAQRRTKK